jgi:hypothetical protein
MKIDNMYGNNLINLLKNQENNSSSDFILNRLNLFIILNKYALNTNKMTQ